MVFDYYGDDAEEADAHARWVGVLQQSAANFVREIVEAGPPDFVRKIFVVGGENRGKE